MYKLGLAANPHAPHPTRVGGSNEGHPVVSILIGVGLLGIAYGVVPAIAKAKKGNRG